MVEFSATYQDYVLRNLPCERVGADEIWSFVGAKAKNATKPVRKNATKPGQGDLWTYTAICATSKLAVSWLVGFRNGENTKAFMVDVAARLARRVQLTTDGLSWCLAAVEEAFGWNGTDYAQLIKTYGASLESGQGRKYSPMECTGAIKTPVMGAPDREQISTSYVERQNLTMRMSMRRFTRLTNGFSRRPRTTCTRSACTSCPTTSVVPTRP